MDDPHNESSFGVKVVELATRGSKGKSDSDGFPDLWSAMETRNIQAKMLKCRTNPNPMPLHVR